MADALRARHVARLGAEDCARLAASSIALCGAGTLGAPLGQVAAMLGIGQRIVDAGEVEPANVGSQSLPAATVGLAKADVRAWQAKLLDPQCRVEALPQRVEELGFGRLRDVDVLVSCLDSRRSRVHLNERSQAFGQPLLDVAVDGSGQQLLGSVACYDPRRGDGACYLCHHSPESFAALAGEGRPAGCPSWRDPDRAVTPPTLASPAFAAVVAGFAAQWLVEILCKRGERFASRLLLVGGDPPRVRSVALRRSPRCPGAHARLAPLEREDAPRVGTLLERAARSLGGEVESLRLPGSALVLGLRCPGCGERRDLVRERRRFADAEVTCGCGRELEPLRLGERLSGAEARRLAERSWGELGLPEAAVVSARRRGREIHYLLGSAASARPEPGR
jgi:molybdopterin/thiamine biosynthesis adenylyltransferase